MSWRIALIIVVLPWFSVRAFEKASSLSPLICRTGLILIRVPIAAAAGVIRPPFFRYFRVSSMI